MMPIWVLIGIGIVIIVLMGLAIVFGERTFKDKADVFYGNDVKDWNKDSSRNIGRTKHDDYKR